MSAVEKFPILLSDAEEESSAVPPCFSHEGINVCCPTLVPIPHRIPRSPESSPISSGSNPTETTMAIGNKDEYKHREEH